MVKNLNTNSEEIKMADCIEKKVFENYFRMFSDIAMIISANIATLEIMEKKAAISKASILYDISPNFATITFYNCFSNTVILIASCLKKTENEENINSFLKYCEKNKEKIFTKNPRERKLQEASNVNMEMVENKLLEFRKLIIMNEFTIKKINENRNKLYAHFSTKMFNKYATTDNGTTTSDLDVEWLAIEDFKELLVVIETIINEIVELYNGTKDSCKLVGSNDLICTLDILRTAEENKKKK